MGLTLTAAVPDGAVFVVADGARIDQMIEMKTELADNVIGSGENWLTELSLNQLKDVLMLRPDSVAEGIDSGDELAEAAR